MPDLGLCGILTAAAPIPEELPLSDGETTGREAPQAPEGIVPRFSCIPLDINGGKSEGEESPDRPGGLGELLPVLLMLLLVLLLAGDIGDRLRELLSECWS